MLGTTTNVLNVIRVNHASKFIVSCYPEFHVISSYIHFLASRQLKALKKTSERSSLILSILMKDLILTRKIT